MPERLSALFGRATTSGELPGPGWVLLAAAIALALVAVPRLWRISRHVVTLAHEGAHAAVARLCGRRINGIRLHTDTSGLTISSGRPRGAGVVLTMAAGYPGPSLVGLGAAWLLARGYAFGALLLVLVLLAVMLTQIRNWFGLLSVLVAGGLVLAATAYLPSAAQSAFAYGVVWFLLLGSPRSVVELAQARRSDRTRSSDADQLARLTHLPALVWVGVFLIVTLGALALGTAGLVDLTAKG